MTYLVKTSSFCFLISYNNKGKGFRKSNILTINKSASKEIESFLKSNKVTNFIEILKKRKIDLKNLKIKGSYEKIFPLHVQIELTDGCNLSCKYCYRDALLDKTKKEDISFKKLLSFLEKEKEKEKNLLEIGVTGGEPTLHPDFLVIMKYVLSNFELVELITNGTNSKKILELLNTLTKEEKNKLNLSVSFHDWFKNAEKLKKGDHYLNEVLKNICKIHPTRFILTDFNYDQKRANEIKSFLEKKGVSYVDFSFISPIGRAKEKISEQENINNYPNKEGKRNPDLNPLNCSLVLKHATITPSGKLRPCALFPVEMNLGDISKGFIEEKYNFLHYLPSPCKAICKDCSYLKYCEGCIVKGLYNSNKNCIYKEKLKKQRDFIGE